MDRKTPLIVLTGPTGSGKTDLLLRLSNAFPIEVVSADSMQVYRHMDIATAKPDASERMRLPHHLIDVVDPDEAFNAGMFVSMARERIVDISSRGMIPVISGGTGLYIKALIYGLSPAPPRDEKLRGALRKMELSRGPGFLWKFLDKNDPASAARIGVNDSSRLVRYIEMLLLSGRRPSEINRSHGFATPLFDARIICMMPERKQLYDRINKRVMKMVEMGLVPETENLLSLGYDRSLKSMQTLGYKHIISCLDGTLSLEDAIGLIQRDTRHYAKRQTTWFKSHFDEDDIVSPDEAMPCLRRLLAA